MWYWERVLLEVLNKDDPAFEFFFTNFRDYQLRKDATKKFKKEKPVSYPVGSQYPEVRFSPCEAQCMRDLLQGVRVIEIAKKLKISRKTVEYYIKRMRAKLNCKTKAELIEKVSRTDFFIHEEPAHYSCSAGSADLI